MASTFWDPGVIYINGLPHDVMINAQYYSNLLNNYVYQVIQKTRTGKVSKKIILLYGNVHSYIANLMTTTLATMGWEIINHPPYSNDLDLGDFHLCGPVEVHV
jgi:histone-lysine N-methyltransferase SETMAR